MRRIHLRTSSGEENRKKSEGNRIFNRRERTSSTDYCVDAKPPDRLNEKDLTKEPHLAKEFTEEAKRKCPHKVDREV